MRSLSKRIDLSERAQIEAQRTLSTVAADIQAASREQAEAFARFAERIDRVEKNSDTAPLRDAVRGLHQGVARLTEQIGKTAAESAGQVAVLANSIEAMALKIASVRDESVRLEHVIEERLGSLSERLKQMEDAGPGRTGLAAGSGDSNRRGRSRACARRSRSMPPPWSAISARSSPGSTMWNRRGDKARVRSRKRSRP